ncbi:hypothetical protein HN51_052062 [Arachis hypogaea]
MELGFPIQSPSDFNNVIEAFGWEEFPYHGDAAPHSNVICRVFTANESPPKPFPKLALERKELKEYVRK